MTRRLFLAVGAGLTALVVSVAGASAQVDPLAVYQRYRDATTRGDVAAVVDLFTDDGVFVGGGGCRPTPCVGKAAIRRAFESIGAVRQQATNLTTEVSGNTVTFRAEVRSDAIRAAGLGRIITAGTAEVRGDKLAAVRALPDPSDPDTARYLAWQAAQTGAPAPAALPRAGSVPAGVAVVLSGALVTGGYALRSRRRPVGRPATSSGRDRQAGGPRGELSCRPRSTAAHLLARFSGLRSDQ